MAFRTTLRTRLQALQEPIAGIDSAELNVPVAITSGGMPKFINFFGATTYTSLQGQGEVLQADMEIIMRLYMGAFNTVATMETLADTLVPLVEQAFLGNSMLCLNNSPLSDINEARLNSNSGITSQQYIVGAGQSEDFYAVVEFPMTVSYLIRTETC